jgi:hypothetical protein
MAEEKIRVEFEFTPEQVQQLIEMGEKQPRTMSMSEVQALGASGAIRAADFLSESQLEATANISLKWISKAAGKVVSKISSPKVQKVTITAGVTLVGVEGEEGEGPLE